MQVKTKGARRITFEQFLTALSKLAERKVRQHHGAVRHCHNTAVCGVRHDHVVLDMHANAQIGHAVSKCPLNCWQCFAQCTACKPMRPWQLQLSCSSALLTLFIFDCVAGHCV